MLEPARSAARPQRSTPATKKASKLLHPTVLTTLSLVIVLGITAQWLAWRVKLASILLLLLFGILAGPVAGLLDTDALLGDLLFPLVSLSVAIILFEGGLSLRVSDLHEIGHMVRNIVTLGALVTWGVGALAAHFILGLDPEIALLLGAILTVTGPTVVIPLLKQVRPSPRVSSVLRWEGIVIDPVGAVLAVLVFEQILAGQPGIGMALVNLAETLVIGGVIGSALAYALIEMFRRYWVPDTLHNPVTLMAVLGAFALSNQLQAESGLFTVTLMGILMANQDRFDVKHIVEFKENLQVLLISALFILLGARLDLGSLVQLGGGVLLFIAILMFVARPLAVWLSARGSGLTWREQVFVSWMAPRGIVAASVSSVFAIELAGHGHAQAELLVPITFSVIIVTVTVYSLTAGALARYLGLTHRNPQGVLLVGAHSWGRRIAAILQGYGFRVIVADSNPANILSAQTNGLEICYGNILSDFVADELDLSDIGHVISITPNDEVNSLTCLHFKSFFGQGEVYQLPPRQLGNSRTDIASWVGGRNLFRDEANFDHLNLQFTTGAELKAIRILDSRNFDTTCLPAMLPMFTIMRDSTLHVWTADNLPRVETGQIVIGLVDLTELDRFATQEIVAAAEQERAAPQQTL